MSTLRRLRCFFGFHRPLLRGADRRCVYVCADCWRYVGGRGDK